MITKEEIENLAVEYDRSLKTHPMSAVELRKDLTEFAIQVVKKLNIPVVINSVCYHGGFEKATKYIDCENTDCKTCECNQQTDL